MRNGVRIGWIVVGGALSVMLVAVITVSVWVQLRLPHPYDFAYPGSYDSSLVSRQASESDAPTVYTLTSPWVIVDATGRVGVRVVPGAAGRLSVKREIAWPRASHGLRETWENGKTLRVRLTCSESEGANESCLADYTLGVPSGAKVMIATPSGTEQCPLKATETICRYPSGGRTE